jgi:predicted phosphodiesterase
MRFAVISDIHMGPEKFYKGVKLSLTDHALSCVKKFVDEINQDPKIKFVVQLGDVIDSTDLEYDKENYNLVLNLLKKLNCPVYHVVGNHDLQHLSEQGLKEIINYKELYYSFDVEDFHCIILFSKTIEKTDIKIDEEQINWLKQDLEKTNKKTLIFVHYSLSDQDLTGHSLFEGFPEVCLIQNREEIRSILTESKKVIAVFIGHLHWNRIDKHNSIPYFTLQSLVENLNNEGMPSNSYAIIDLTKDSIKVDIKGNDPQVFESKI